MSARRAVADCQRARGYDVLVGPTHGGAAASVIARERVDFPVAAVHAPGEDRSGAHLAEARLKKPGMAILIILSDPHEPTEDAPLTAIHLIRPLVRAEMERTLAQATTIASPGSARRQIWLIYSQHIGHGCS